VDRLASNQENLLGANFDSSSKDAAVDRVDSFFTDHDVAEFGSKISVAPSGDKRSLN